MSNWFYKYGDDGMEFGPVSSSQLKELAKRNAVTPATLIRREDTANWHPASKARGLDFSGSMPANQRATNSTSKTAHKSDFSSAATNPPPLQFTGVKEPYGSGDPKSDHGIATSVHDEQTSRIPFSKPAPEAKSNPNRWLKVAFVCAIGLIAVNVVVFVAFILFRGSKETTDTAKAPSPEVTEGDSAKNDRTVDQNSIVAQEPSDQNTRVESGVAEASESTKSPAQLYRELSPAVVTIQRLNGASKVSGQGTGFLLSTPIPSTESPRLIQRKNESGGYDAVGFAPHRSVIIVTNEHVIRGAASLEIKSGNGADIRYFTILAQDRDIDLAVLEGFIPTSASYTEIEPDFGNASSIGEHVYAIGNPKALAGSMSDGIISGYRNRGSQNLIQTTVPISPGSSGSPLLNPQGRAIGVVVASITDAQNVNFAVSIQHVIDVIVNATERRRVGEGVDPGADRIVYFGEALRAYDGDEDSEKNAVDRFNAINEQVNDGNYVEAYEICLRELRTAPASAKPFFNFYAAECICEWINSIQYKAYEEKRFPTEDMKQPEVVERMEDAHSRLRGVLRVKPRFVKAYVCMDSLLEFVGTEAERLENSRRFANACPNSPDARFMYAIALAKAERFEEAHQNYAAAIELDPTDSNKIVVYAGSLASRNQFRLALATVDEAISAGHKIEMLGYLRAEALFGLKRYDDALAQYESIDPPIFDTRKKIEQCRWYLQNR